VSLFAKGGTPVKRYVAASVLVLGLGTAVTLAEPDPLKFSAILLETAPLAAPGLAPATYEASLVNVGPNTASGFILFCDSSNGTCTAGLGCTGSVLAPGQGCNSAVADVEAGPIWARLVLIRFGDKKPIDARGSLQVQHRTAGGEGFASEAVSRPGGALVTEGPTR
jgi:hypothetical protein